MKKVLVLFICLIAALGIYADRGNASCKIDEIPNAYVYAEVNVSPSNYCKIAVTSYGVKEGTVEVQFDWKNSEGKTDTVTKLISFRNGKGGVEGNMFIEGTNVKISNVRVFNPICK